jgi:purine-binding chemotaxis protein CheW
MNDKTRQQQGLALAQPGQALVNYLDTLLAEIDLSPGSVVTEPIKARPAGADILQQEMVVPEGVTEPVQLASEGDESRLERVPAWAQAPFQVLRFMLQGARLAIPLLGLRGILPLTERLARLPGQPPWAMGLVLNRDAKVVVVDTRQLLMAPLRRVEDKPFEPTHLLLIGEGDRGLAVDGLIGTLTLEKEAVRWRAAAGDRPWYAGVIVEELCVLLDVDGVMEILSRAVPRR